jgi:hypothetical protein
LFDIGDSIQLSFVYPSSLLILVQPWIVPMRCITRCKRLVNALKVERPVDEFFHIFLLQGNMLHLIALVSLLLPFLAAGSSSVQLETFATPQKLSLRQSDPLGQAQQPVRSLIISGRPCSILRLSFLVRRREMLYSCLNLRNQYLLQDCGQLLSWGHQLLPNRDHLLRYASS